MICVPPPPIFLKTDITFVLAKYLNDSVTSLEARKQNELQITALLDQIKGYEQRRVGQMNRTEENCIPLKDVEVNSY